MNQRVMCAGLCLALLLLSLPAAAQTFGEITGTVTDSTGAVVPGATVTVTNQATNVARAVQTNEAGNYAVPFLNPGIYDLKAEADGFKAAATNGLQIEVGATVRANFAMEVG